MKKGKGFTLVELLAVIIIFAIIGTVLMLNFDNESSKTTESKVQEYTNRVISAADAYIYVHNGDENIKKLLNGEISEIAISVENLKNEKFLDSDYMIDTDRIIVRRSTIGTLEYDLSGQNTTTPILNPVDP